MRFRRFTVYTLIGSLVWCVALATLGHAFGDRWTEVERVLRPFGWVMVGVAVVALVVFISRRWTQVRREYAALDAERAAQGEAD